MADRVLTVKVQGDTAGLGRSFQKASKQSETFGSHMQHHIVGGLHAVAKAATYAGGIIGVSYVAALGDGVKLAGDNQVAVTKLKKAVDNSGLSWKKLGGHLQETQDKMAGLSGFTNTELETSLGQLITTTGKAASAQKLQGEAMDLARARSMPLANATTILSKAWNGNVTSLTRLGISLPKSTKHYDAYMASTKHATAAGKAAAKAADLVANRQAALAALQKKFGGSWKAYANTGEGALARIRAGAEILLERLGKVMLPYLNRLATWFNKELPTIQRIGTRVFGDLGQAIKDVVKVGERLIGFYERWSTWIQAAAAFVGTLVAGIEIYIGVTKAITIATEAWAAAQAILNIMLDANPIGIAIIAAATLAAAFVVLWKRSGTFRDVVKHVLHDVQIAFGAVTGFIHDHWHTVMGFVESAARHVWQVVGPIIGFIHDHWKTLLAFMTGGTSVAVQFIVNHWDTIKSAVSRVVGFVIHRWGNIKSAISAFAGWVNHYIIGPINYIIKKAKEAIGWLEKLNPFSSGPGTGGQGRGSAAGPAAAQMYARSRLANYGWQGSQMSPLVTLWNTESGWNNLARNPQSGAYGIPQALPASKMGAAANPPTSSATAQIDWGLGYIKGRYGTPAAAWAQYYRHPGGVGWYDQGGVVPGPRGVHRPAMVAGGETILPTHKGGGFGTTIIVNMPAGFMVGTAAQFENAVRKAVVGALRRNGPNAFVPTLGARI